MSADSPRRGCHKSVQVVSPQPVNDRSIIDSVAGIINDIVPQAYTGGCVSESKESITWARFEYADVNDPSLFPDYIEGSSTPPLLLVLGYTTGVQVWLVAASGEATEILSWRQSVVRVLRILPNPITNTELSDPYKDKRPLIAICDSAGPGPQFCNVNFISLKTGEQTKSIKFKNPVCDVLANKRSIVVTFSEKIAVFDARTFEDILTVTSCYPSPGPNPNPVALGTRWLAYSEKKLLPTRRSSGGSEGEGVPSYTAAVLYAAKSLSKGLRGFGESVASSLTGNSIPPVAVNNTSNDVTQPGIITILDLQASKQEKQFENSSIETVVAHFTAHNDAIVAMAFDLTGAILMTADKRGHDFHIFRIQAHPGGPSLAAVHHLYVLHRGDTTAKVQDMVFSCDTRWAAVSTVRGTTHVFPVAPYGGPVGVRTHSTPHVVNRLSRFHRSAGLTDDSTRSHSPVSHAEIPLAVYPYSNPRLPPYPYPTVLHPLAQIRQPSTLNHTNNQSQSRPQQRQRLHSDDNGSLPLKICACFAPSRAWTYNQRDSSIKVKKGAVDSLFIMACHGNMIQYDLEPKPTSGVPKEKVCDNTMIELEVEAKGQWPLLRTPNSIEILPPLLPSSPLLNFSQFRGSQRHLDSAEDRWLSQVEIVTHAGPHRRLWMGPQFIFKTYNAPSGVNLIDAEAIEIGVSGGSRPARSNPVNMPHTTTRAVMPVVIDGSGSSYEQSPRFMEAYGDSLEGDIVPMGNGENQLREDLAEAMLETSTASHRAPGRRLIVERVGQPVTKVVNPLGTVITVLADEEDVSSSQEFDGGQEYISEIPKSVCAEEGPASLVDFDSESNLLRNLTEICAEMRATSESAFDNVPYESVKDVKEQKTLCVEAATMNAGEHAIDFERADAFRDIPTSLNLCKTKRCEKSEIQESNIANAKYVVSYDEDNVVFIENKSTNIKTADHHLDSIGFLTDQESEQASKRQGKNPVIFPVAKRIIATGTEQHSKYLLRESGDSVVIEDTTMIANDKITKENENIVKTEDELEEQNKNVITMQYCTEIEPMEATVATACGVAHLPLDTPALDEINSMDYHIIERNIFSAKDTTNLHKSDEKIVDTQNLHDLDELIDNNVIAIEPNAVEDYDVSPIRQRKGSKSTISDDDLEHIHPSELSEIFDKAKSLVMDTNEQTEQTKEVSQVPNRAGASSDDDIEHLLHPELSDADQLSLIKSPLVTCNTKSPPINDNADKKSARLGQKSRGCSIRSRTSRKRKDVVVIDREAPDESEITVVVKSLDCEDNWNKSKSPEKDLIEEIDRCMEPKDRLTEHNTPQSLPKKTRVRVAKNSGSSLTQKTSANLVEVIDIDAMQKAELAMATNTPMPECKILESCQEVSMAKMKKSRRNKDIENESTKPSSSEVNDREKNSVDSNNWSAIDQNVIPNETIEIPEFVESSVGKENIQQLVEENETMNTRIAASSEKKISKKRNKKACSNLDSTNVFSTDCDSKFGHGELSDIKVNPENKVTIADNSDNNALHVNDEKITVECAEIEKNEKNHVETNIEAHVSDKDLSGENSDKGKSTVRQQQSTPERSSSNDDLNANIVPMDTEEDSSGIKEIIEKNNSITASPSWSTVGKKNNRSKKKKRR
ncbi:hypothetical protein PV327_005306 [Microctonus hyperodae]|uniref:BCAS3 WD40 domain-containing protein n=1 Tax=Microctonus hyperodae TaxID=165561 RepID=A0AA39G134_MICHY|nr:hypothetical protein PV327_005306 [Microctonus hyperodae]